MKGKIYHVSSTPNITVLEPRVSSHGKAYVYGTTNLNLALLFGSKKSNGDFDGIYGTHDEKPFFYEAYEDALKRRFQNEVCYIYEVDPTSFEAGKTSFRSEVVSEKPVKVIKCTEVKDLYQLLLKLIKKNKIEFQKYSTNPEYLAKIEEHIKDRLMRFGVLDDKTTNIYKFCKEKFPTWFEECEEAKKSTV